MNRRFTLFWSLADIRLEPSSLTSSKARSLASHCFRFFELFAGADLILLCTEVDIGFGMSKDARSALFLAIRSSRSRS